MRGSTAFEATRSAAPLLVLGPPGKPGTSDPLRETDQGKRKGGCTVRSREGILMRTRPRSSFPICPAQALPRDSRPGDDGVWVKSSKTLEVKLKGWPAGAAPAREKVALTLERTKIALQS